MSTKSFAALMARLAATPEGQAAHVAVAYLAQVSARMQAQGISNVELARRMGTSPAYITRLFHGSANLSVQTMVKLAQAVGATLQLELAEEIGSLPFEVRKPTPETVAAIVESREMAAARYGSAKELFDALDQKTGKGKTHASAKKV
ncbi:helix-turn-helix transcriptional regulator [Polaromonas sp. P1(28)-13]|nr:helix-turn-helix transcriptional regulator [Polaromonas sp. P1(28)-13]